MRDDDEVRARRLTLPRGRCRVVVDTDAANEIDDQFALAWALRAPERLDLRAVHAAPFSFGHRRAALGRPLRDERPFNPPGEGMVRSADEITHLFELAGVPEDGRVQRGATDYLHAADQPQRSAAAEHLIALARQAGADGVPLVVLALGCATNVASALMLAPDIADHLIVVWTSAYPSHAPHPNRSFNLEQDAHAARWLFDCGVPLVYMPGFHVGAQLRLSLPEAERHLPGHGRLGDYLFHLFTHNPLWELAGVTDLFVHSWVIWDLICLAWLFDERWVPSTLVRTPRLGDDLCWRAEPGRPLMREAHAVQRDAIFADLFRTLQRGAAETQPR